MSDFGEYLPFDAVLWSAEEAAAVHNAFPRLWAQTCREAQREAGLDGQVAFWSRSATTGSAGYSTAFWAGDQLVTWDAYDGLASALRGILSGGLSGMALAHSDIGGCTAQLCSHRAAHEGATQRTTLTLSPRPRAATR
jgi:alpha-glucosidase